MNIFESASAAIGPALPFLAVLTLVIAGLSLTKFVLERRYAETTGSGFRMQLIMLGLTLTGLLVVIMALPVSDTLRGQLLSLVGILLSASIALSSTTFLGNAMAGVLLRVVGVFQVGDFVRVGDHFGRVSERGLFHTEIQTEDRDLTTLPNSYLVTNPVKVVRNSGTIISTEVSLGYDVPRDEIEKQLLAAAGKAGLEDAFVQIKSLGDFSVVYRAAGLLTDVKSILSSGSRLRGAVMDELHAAGIEIVSPNFMNTRALEQAARFIPQRASAGDQRQADSSPEDVVFDKAEAATALEEFRLRQVALEEEIEHDEALLTGEKDEPERRILEGRIAAAKREHDEIVQTLQQAHETKPE